MTITLDLPPDVEAALRADAQSQGRPAETVATERLASFYEYENAGPEPEAIEAVAQAFARLDAGERGISLDEYVAEVKAERQQRAAANPAAA